MNRFLNFLVCAFFVSCCALSACDSNTAPLYGYIEAELIYLSSPYAGKLIQLYVERGQSVRRGDKLFSLDPLPQSADLMSAKNELKIAQANLANIKKGKRPSEIDAIRAEIEAAQAQVKFLEKQLIRHRSLVNKSALEIEQLDRTVDNLTESKAKIKGLEADLITAKLPAREDEIEAAMFQVKAAQAAVEKAAWGVEEKNIDSPENAEVFDVYYRVGENVNANFPVLSLLAPKNIKVVFFIPEPMLSMLRINQQVVVKCDNGHKQIKATVHFISPKAEYTPPVIYSRSSRSKLVFRVECVIDDQDLTHIRPGQPVDIFVPKRATQ